MIWFAVIAALGAVALAMLCATVYHLLPRSGYFESSTPREAIGFGAWVGGLVFAMAVLTYAALAFSNA